MELSRDIAAIEATLIRLLPANVAVAASDTRQTYPLYAVEQPLNATAARKKEFAAGRHAVRQAMALQGLPQVAVPPAPDRGPQWPQGLVGAITHSAPICLAVIAHRKDYSGLGLDLASKADRPEPDIWPLFLHPAEIVTMRQSGTQDARAFLCAKEAVIKMMRDAFGQTPGFQDLRVTLDPDLAGFVATVLPGPNDLPAGMRLGGTLAQVAGYQLAFCRTTNAAAARQRERTH